MKNSDTLSQEGPIALMIAAGHPPPDIPDLSKKIREATLLPATPKERMEAAGLVTSHALLIFLVEVCACCGSYHKKTSDEARDRFKLCSFCCFAM